MNIALISLTENGRVLSVKLAAELAQKHPVTRFCNIDHDDGNSIPFTRLKHLTKQIFDKYDALVFICAVGIAVRVCAPCIVSKLSDPAVTVVDDSGKFAVAVLSGHLGGANELTRETAEIIGAVPVITTATDSHGFFSPDMFAKHNGFVISDMNAAKAVAAAVVNGEKVGFYCEYPHTEISPELTECDGGKIGICVSGSAGDKPFDTTLNLLPKNLVAGIGCKKGTFADTVTDFVMKVFSDNGLDIRRLAAVATIDIKSDEPGLLAFCESKGLPLKTYTADELMSVPGEFSHSDFVEKTTGADNVCERAAVCAGGRLIVRKTAGNGVTAAVAELPVNISFTSSDASGVR